MHVVCGKILMHVVCMYDSLHVVIPIAARLWPLHVTKAMLAPQQRAGCNLQASQVPVLTPRLCTVRSQAVPSTGRTVSEAQGRRTDKTETQRLSKVSALEPGR